MIIIQNRSVLLAIALMATVTTASADKVTGTSAYTAGETLTDTKLNANVDALSSVIDANDDLRQANTSKLDNISSACVNANTFVKSIAVDGTINCAAATTGGTTGVASIIPGTGITTTGTTDVTVSVDASVTLDSELAAHSGNAAAHHTKFTATDAQNAMGTTLNANPLNHDRYDDAAAKAAVAADIATVAAGLAGKVNKAGDIMTGALTAPALNVNGTSTGGVIQTINNTNGAGSERLYFGTSTGSDAGIIVWGSTSASPGRWRFFNNKTSGHYDWITSGSIKMALINNGNLGIGTTAPTLKLHVNGTAGGTSAYQTISDVKYKKNIVPLQNSLQKVMQLRGVSYDWRNADYPDINFSEGAQVGFIAQEVEPIVPEAVNQDTNGNYSVAYSTLVPVLVEAIKEQQAQIDQLKAELQLLTGP